MVFNRFRILHAPWNSTTQTDISSAVNISHTEAIKATTDTFSFSVPAQSTYDDFFDIDDNIKIYFWSDSSSETLVMDGYIDSIQKVLNVDQNNWQIKGINRLERLLNVQISINLSNDTAPNMIADIIDKVNDQNISRGLMVEKKNKLYSRSAYGCCDNNSESPFRFYGISQYFIL